MNSSIHHLAVADHSIDVTGELCPMTFVHVRLALDRLPPAAKLAVVLRGDEARRNVPRTAVEQGHQILSTIENLDGTTCLLIQKKG